MGSLAMNRLAMNHLATIGFGYTAQAVAKQLDMKEWRVTGSSRTETTAMANRAQGYEGLVLTSDTPVTALVEALSSVTHILISAAPTTDGDPIIGRLTKARAKLPKLSWIGYLSTVGVYGNHDGGWVDEDTRPKPSSRRGKLRLKAESDWHSFEGKHGIAVQVFRLPGIYGPGRNAFERLQAGMARRINKPGQVFNRMHVDDIAGALLAAMRGSGRDCAVFNLVDDLPAAPQDVIAFAAERMGVTPPLEVAYEAADMTDMARSFSGESKRVSNKRMKEMLDYEPMYPTYREGLAAIWDGIER
jgi:nucleoside-diphosphate-sugar epimerase